MPIDIAGFITYLKDHAIEHGFHVHDERHFLETYSLRQSWEVDLHPESACSGPLDLNLAFDVDPRVLLKLEDHVNETDEDDFADPGGEYRLPLYFNWALPSLANPPDLVILASELGGIAGPNLPIDVSAVDSFGALSEKPDRRLSLVGRVEVSLVDVMTGDETLCETLDLCRDVSEYLVEQSAEWDPIEGPPSDPRAR